MTLFNYIRVWVSKLFDSSPNMYRGLNRPHRFIGAMILLWSLSFLRSISSSLKAVIITRGYIQRIMMMRELISFSYAIVTTQVSWSKSICFFAKWGRFFFPFVVELFQKVSLIFVLSPFVSNKCELYR